MSTAFAGEAAHVHELGQLSPALIARATGADETSARNWINGKSSPTGSRAERLGELSALVERLVQVIEPSYLEVWLIKPVAALHDDKPADVIAAGRYREVSRLISALESPISA